jgi:Ca2+-transporting ATPase
VATVAVLAVILGVPAVSALFSFAAPSPTLLLAGVGAAVLGFAWFEAVKWVLTRNAPLTSRNP